MIIGIGIDAVTISRLEKWAANKTILERFFHPREIEGIREKGRGMVRSLAARFAAKEAFGKALGTGLAGIALKDIMVLNDSNGRPELLTEGSALFAIKKAGVKRIHLSLTHEGDTAIASVVLET
ncbi:holo-[acyl-carrier-protein] synthase [Spirochaetia bacterium]|nr:holo-[acyl-carrier-protein] synthase [Spirochaetia bacterium]